jgi:hypothetical protein
MLAEYWANTDSLLFFRQLGVRAVPARGSSRRPGRPAIFRRRPRQLAGETEQAGHAAEAGNGAERASWQRE